MRVTLDHLLRLVGRLDDAPGFDSPRERFRRFLLEHAGALDLIRPFIEQGQHAPGEQHRRAMRDLVVVLGQFLGFEVQFGTYGSIGDGELPAGRWRARSRLSVTVDVRSPHSTHHRLDALRAAVRDAGHDVAHAVGVVVMTSETMREKVDEAIARGREDTPISSISLRSLLALADAFAAGTLNHDHIVRLFEAQVPADFIADVLGRLITPAPAQPATSTATAPAVPAPAATPDETARAAEPTVPEPTAAPPVAPPESDEPSYWVATIGPDHATRPEEFLELVVGRRQVLGIVDAGATRTVAGAGDRVCFYIAGKGVVGHARVTARAATDGLRDAHRFRQVLHIDEVTLHLGSPVPLDAETSLRLRTAGLVTSRQAPTLVRISRDSFLALTSPGGLRLSG